MALTSFSFVLPTPDGETPVSDEVLHHPLLLNAGAEHPTLTMADYFAALQQLVLTHEDSFLMPMLQENLSTPLHCKISSEKLGAFYHVARVEFQGGGKKASLAVNTAVSKTGKQCLATDHQLLSSRLPTAMRRFVPKIYLYTGDENQNEAAAFHHLVVEWLEDFHEWHLCSTENSEPQFTLWTDKGAYPFGERASRTLFRQIAHIITLSYEWERGSFLQRWHHAAGDFIARCDDHDLEVRLVTVRAIEPFPFLAGQELQVRLSSLLLFLIDLSIRMRLDKLDGVGKTVWLDDFVVEETVRGFLEGLVEHCSKLGEVYETLLHLLPRFSPDELRQLSTPLLPFYEERLSAADLAEVKNNFASHLEYLASCLTDLVRGKSEHPPLPIEPS
ncbi:MAG: hypothetical protein P8130_10115 [Deltaproteobacteria bacterium]